MTKQTQVRSTEEALKLALEALNLCPKDILFSKELKQIKSAITAIKEALMSQSDGAQPAVTESHKQSTTCGEPVEFVTPLMEQQMFDEWCPYKGILPLHPRVVWAGAVEAVNDLLLGDATPPPVAEPHKRKPLTDEQIQAVAFEAVKDNWDWLKFARAIEAAHGIKGDA